MKTAADRPQRSDGMAVMPCRAGPAPTWRLSGSGNGEFVALGPMCNTATKGIVDFGRQDFREMESVVQTAVAQRTPTLV